MGILTINSDALIILYKSVEGGFDPDKADSACNNAESPTIIGYILDSETFETATGIYTDNTGATRAISGWYSNGTRSRRWDSVLGTFPEEVLCPTPIISVTVSPSTANITVPNTTALSLTFVPAAPTNTNGTWTTSDPLVATVDTSGVVTAVGVGTATITFTTTISGQSDSCVVTVT